jgi:hypothetical protein
MLSCAQGCLRLEIAFDAAQMCAEADAIEATAWEPHFNRALYRGDWSGVVLRGRGGFGLYPNPHAADEIRDRPLLDRCPTVRRLVESLEWKTSSVRFLRLGPDSEIYEHCDHDLTLEGGEARLHFWLRSNDAVAFELDRTPVPMREGECWYLDVSRPHRVVNAGASARLALVVDCLLETPR